MNPRPRPDREGRRTLRLPFDLDAGDRGRYAVAITLTMELLEDDDGRLAIGIRDFIAWLDGRGAHHQLAVVDVIDRARRAARSGRWEEFAAKLQNGHGPDRTAPRQS